MIRSDSQLTALMIAPDLELARQFESALCGTRAFQVLAVLKSYPPRQTLEMRLRQLRPDVVLLDLSTNLESACELIPPVAALRPPVPVIGLHQRNDREAVVRSLRLGAADFLYAPFDAATQREAVASICRLRRPDGSEAPAEPGKVILICSPKPGSGSTTVALGVAFGIQGLTGSRVLLADFDFLGGTLGYSLQLTNAASTLDLLRNAEQLDSGAWATLAAHCGPVDVLPSPDAAATEPVAPTRLHSLLESARAAYSWIVLDMPPAFQKITLLALPESDFAFLVTTPELPSLHLARRAVALLSNLGFDKERFQVIVNRTGKRDGIGGSDVEKILQCRVEASLPEKPASPGAASGKDSGWGRALHGLAGRIAGVPPGEKRSALRGFPAAPALSEG